MTDSDCLSDWVKVIFFWETHAWGTDNFGQFSNRDCSTRASKIKIWYGWLKGWQYFYLFKEQESSFSIVHQRRILYNVKEILIIFPFSLSATFYADNQSWGSSGVEVFLQLNDFKIFHCFKKAISTTQHQYICVNPFSRDLITPATRSKERNYHTQRLHFLMSPVHIAETRKKFESASLVIS